MKSRTGRRHCHYVRDTLAIRPNNQKRHIVWKETYNQKRPIVWKETYQRDLEFAP